MKDYLTKETPTRLLTWADTSSDNFPLFQKVLHGIVRIFFITTTEYKKNDLSLRASALTYVILLSLVPLLAISTALVKGLGDGDKLRTAIYTYVDNLENQESPQEPDTTENPERENTSSLSKHLKSAVDKIFNYVDRTNFTRLGTFGILGMVLSVILVLGNIEGAMNTIWHITSGRSIMRKIADYMALVVLMPLSLNFGLAAGAVVTSESLLSKFSILLPALWVQALLLNLIPIFFLSLTLFVIYLFFPNTKVKPLPALTGAIIAGFFWFEIQNLYLKLQIGVTNYNAIYGSFATLPLFLVWMYFGWVFILLGAQIAFACQNRATYQLLPKVSTPALQLSAAFDIVSHVYEAFNDGRPTSQERLQETFTDYDPDLLGQVVKRLITAKLLHTTQEDGAIMPSSPIEQARHEHIILAIFGTDEASSPGAINSGLAIEAAGKAKFRTSG